MTQAHDISRSMFRTTLTQHILSQRDERFNERLASLITQIGVAAKMIAAQVRRAGIIEVWGETGETNIQGEEVQKLDMIANHTFIEVLRRSGSVVAMASEEEDDWVDVSADVAPNDHDQGGYLVMFDPLDGSSNIEVSTSIGTIFGVYACEQTPQETRDLLRPGREMIGAGYVIYGSSTVFVYADATRVDCFTLDPTSGEFLLSRPNLKIPQKLSMVSINEYNEVYWPAWMKDVMAQLKARNSD
jgi:fructose-1,6-bisphosphatase I